MNDAVAHPEHYEKNLLGSLECIDIAEHMSFSAGNIFKYAWRAGFKSDNAEQDLRKALQYNTFWMESEHTIPAVVSDVSRDQLKQVVKSLYDFPTSSETSRDFYLTLLIEGFIEESPMKVYAVISEMMRRMVDE